MSSASSSAPSTSSATFSASARGATFLILIQVLSRALTFAINQVLLRYLSPALLGASTQLELYSISVLYFARESIRVALQRATGDAQSVVNLSYISILAGFPLAFGLGTLYARSTSIPDNVPFSGTAIFLFGVAAVIELLSEPCFVLAQQKLAYKVRAAAETGATISRCIMTIGVVAWAHRRGQNLGVLPFGIGQLTFAVTLFLIYYARTVPIARASGAALIPRKPASIHAGGYVYSLFPRPLISLAANLTLQSSIKYVLTHGAGLLVAALTTLHEQGVYALAANYGGLAARMLFQPLEESGRNLFGRLCAPVSAPVKKDTQDEQGQRSAETKPREVLAPAPAGLTQASTTLTLLLRFYAILALAAWSLGPTLAPLGLRIIAGQKWADIGAGEVLATYCYYIPLLAVNGITEAFVSAVATNAELKRQSALMAIWFIAFASAAWVLLKVMGRGAQGLVIADCLNMALRILWNVRFVKAYFARHGKEFSISSALPSTTSFAVSLSTAAAAIMRRNRVQASLFNELIENIGGATLFTGVILVLERDFFVDCWRLFKQRR